MAYTVASHNYAPSIRDAAAMVRRLGRGENSPAFDEYLFVCMDRDALAAACATCEDNAARMVLRRRRRRNDERSTGTRMHALLVPSDGAAATTADPKMKQRVEFAKFHTAWALARRGVNFLFFEMDVYFQRSPRGEAAAGFNGDSNGGGGGGLFALHFPWSAAQRRRVGLRMHRGRIDQQPLSISAEFPFESAQAAESAAPVVVDLLVSVHQDVPFAMNIGFFSVLGNDRTAFLFARLLAILKDDPSLKDQRVFINLCRHPESKEDLWGGVFGLVPPHAVASHTVISEVEYEYEPLDEQIAIPLFT